MALKAFVKSLDQVDEQFHDLYKQDDDGFVLDLEDKDFKSKLDEFRSNNRKLHKDSQAKQELEQKIEALRQKGFDPDDADKLDEFLEAYQKAQKQQDQDLLEKGQVDELVEKRVQKMREESEKQVKQLQSARDQATTERDTLRERLGKLLIDASVQKAVNSTGSPRQGAIDDILNRARNDWQIDEDGELRPAEIYDEKGDPITTMDEWANQLIQKAPYLFEGGSGGGASGGKKETDTNAKSISADDRKGFSQNLEAIAKGQIKVKQ